MSHAERQACSHDADRQIRPTHISQRKAHTLLPMIDIHAHIIPALDDGPADMETSVGLGTLAEREGIQAIISTSHSTEARYAGREDMESRLEAVRVAWGEAGLNIRLELGVEIMLRPDTAKDLQAGHLWTMAGSRYVLVEVPYQPWPGYADQAMFDLQIAGFIPILAHPERYTAIQEDLEKMYALSERGILGQVTAAALLGEHGAATRRCAEMLMRHYMVQFIATDSHSVKWRSPRVREALMVAEEMVGVEMAGAMAHTNPAKILANEPITPEPRQPERRKKLFGGLFGK